MKRNRFRAVFLVSVCALAGLTLLLPAYLDASYAEQVARSITARFPDGSRAQYVPAFLSEQGYSQVTSCASDEARACFEQICDPDMVVEPGINGYSIQVDLIDKSFAGLHRRSVVTISADRAGRISSVSVQRNIHLRQVVVLP
jgi:hypothetical protein